MRFNLFAWQGAGRRGKRVACCCQNEIQRTPRLDFLNEFSDAMNSCETVIYFVTGARYIAVHTNKPDAMTFSLSEGAVINQNQQV